jgi:hypothetical protein
MTMLAALSACRGDKAPPPARPSAAPATSAAVQLALQLPDQPGWNQEDSIVVTVTNGTAAAVTDASLELTVQAPVAVLRDSAAAPKPAVDSTATATKLTFALGAIDAGKSVEIHQRVRTPPAPVAPTPPPAPASARPSAVKPKPAAPAAKPDTSTRFLVRARLLRPDEMELASAADTLRIRAGSEVTIGGCGNASDVVVTRYGIGPVRVGMPVAALRAACPEARDTTWKGQEGMTETGLVALPGGRRVVAVTAGGTVQRIVIDQGGLRTAGGDSVGTTVGELRASYGRMCAGRSERRLAVWFPNAPGLSFALDSAATTALPPAQTSADSIPDEVRVSSLWIRQGRDDCP